MGARLWHKEAGVEREGAKSARPRFRSPQLKLNDKDSSRWLKQPCANQATVWTVASGVIRMSDKPQTRSNVQP
jgi:hypothetical protein